MFRAKVYGVAGFERQFAVKCFHPELVKDPEIAALIAAAARKYGSLEHPRIARLQEYGVAGGDTFTAVELVVGLDIARLIEAAARSGSQIPIGAVVDLVSQAARAVGFAHGRGIPHLGICPTNLVCNEDGVVKVTDFGVLPPRLPRRPANDYSLSMRIPYLAPEQLVGEPTSSATDVFQLGVVAYELFTGKRAFAGATPLDVSQKILSSVPAAPPLPKALLKVLMRCMARSPFERYPDAGALADALDAASRVTPVPGGQRDIATTVRAGIAARKEVSEAQVSGALSFPLPAPPSSSMSQLLSEGVAAPPAASARDTGIKKTMMGVRVPTPPPEIEVPHSEDDDTQVRARSVGFVKPRAPFGLPAGIPPIPVRTPGQSPPVAQGKSNVRPPMVPLTVPLPPAVGLPPVVSAPPPVPASPPAPIAAASPPAPMAAVPAPPIPGPGSASADFAPATDSGPADIGALVANEVASKAELGGLEFEAASPILFSPPGTLSDEPKASPRADLVAAGPQPLDDVGELEAMPLPLMPDPPATVPSTGRASSGVSRGLLAVLAMAVFGAGGFFAYNMFLGDGDKGPTSATPANKPAPKTPAGGPSARDAALRVPTKLTPFADAGVVATKPTPSDAGTKVTPSPPDAAVAVAVAPPDAAVAVAVTPPDAATKAGAPSGDGKLRISSTPKGAKIYIDGTYKGRTPKTFDEYPDTHKLVLIKPGFKLFTRQVSGSPSIDQTLEAVSPPGGPAGIKVRCKKKNRYYVFVDGRDIGMLCPTERIGVDMGMHVVEIYDPVTDSRRTFQAKVKQTRNSLRVRVD